MGRNTQAAAAQNPGFANAMAALANLSHAPRMIQPTAWSRALQGRASGASVACVSDLFLAMSGAMAAEPEFR